MKHRTFLIAAATCAVLLVSGVTLAANYTLNQTLPLSITITQPSAGGGGVPLPPAPTTAVLYEDKGLTTPLTRLTITYPVSGQATVTAYVKTVEIQALGPVTVTLNNAGPTVTATLGVPDAGSTPVILTAAGGTAGNYTGTVNITGGGVPQ